MIEHFGRYQVLSLIGEGGMARVYLAEDPHLGRLVAVKATNFHLHDQDAMQEHFLNEARIAASLKNQHVVEIYDFGVEANNPFFIMEYVEGYNLAEVLSTYLEAKIPLPQKFCASVMLQAIKALAAAQKIGVVHGDIKPANLIIGHDGILKVSDFGLARIATWDRASSSANILGTPSYIAPEIFKGEQPSFASDYWALGVTIYQLLAGKCPFHGTDSEEIKRQIKNCDLEPIHQSRGNIDASFGQLIMRLLDKDPSKRLCQADEMIEILSLYLKNEGVKHTEECIQGILKNSVVTLPSKATARVGPTPTTSTKTFLNEVPRTDPNAFGDKSNKRLWILIGTAFVLLMLGWILTTILLTPSQTYQKVEKVRVMPESLFLQLGEKLQLRASIEPANAPQHVDWESDRPSVVSVSRGIVGGKSLGQARVFVFSVADPKQIDTCHVLVMPALVESISFQPKKLSLELGEKFELTPVFTPPEAATELQWKVIGPPKVSVKGGVVTSLEPGVTKVKAVLTQDASKFAICEIRVIGSQQQTTVYLQSPATGKLRVLSSPPHADLRVQGEKWGNTPMRNFRSISSGKIRIQLEHRDFPAKDTIVFLKANEELKLHLTLGSRH